jgi:hypothetical protein
MCQKKDKLPWLHELPCQPGSHFPVEHVPSVLLHGDLFKQWHSLPQFWPNRPYGHAKKMHNYANLFINE